MPTTPVLDSTISHRETTPTTSSTTTAPPLVFLHGNPTSSHLWRNVIPNITWPGRILAPDLIGMGDSGKPDIAYTFDDQSRYLDAWFDALHLNEVVLVGHDWGGALAFDRSARHPTRVKAIAVTETIVKPMEWTEFPPAGADLFAAIKTPGLGETMLLDQNLFLDLTNTVDEPMSNEDAETYRRPFPTPKSRRPILEWARSMPLGDEPKEVVDRVKQYGTRLATSPNIPKLLITFKPTYSTMMTKEMYDWCTSNMAALEIDHHPVTAGHHTPEDRPKEIATSINNWADRHALTKTTRS